MTLARSRAVLPPIDRRNPLDFGPRHHATHARLLRHGDPDSVVPARVDAVIVPTARPAAYLRNALPVAQALGCPLLALCSRFVRADEVMTVAADWEATVIAVDVPAEADLPTFETSTIFDTKAFARFARRTDTSLKRNIGLVAAKAAGWRRVVFLDDDVAVADPTSLRIAAGMLREHDAVGLANDGFPDNSVVCHAYRAVGEYQDCFVGAGALAVQTSRLRSFFPKVYNEDWFFLLGDAKLSTVGITGWATQSRFDPFARPDRARSEEFGDTLAEGVYALLDDGRRIQDADETFWAAFLDHRRELIAKTLNRIPGLDLADGDHRRMTEAIKAALGRQLLIEPGLCTAFLRAWHADRDRWQKYLRKVPREDATRALARLGLTPTVHPARS